MSRNFLTLFFIVLICGTLFCEMADAAKRKKGGSKGTRKLWKRSKRPNCSLQLKKVLVQKKFNIDRFTGTWYTILRTTELFGEDTYESPSMEITKTADGKYTYSLTGRKRDKTCIPVETGSLELSGRKGLMHLNGEVTMVVSFTGYKDLAIVYYCFKLKPGRKDQCSPDGIHVEILSRGIKIDRKLLKDYIKRTAKRLCVQPKRLKYTTPGLCIIPDILEAAKKVDIDIEKPKDGDKADNCAVDNVRVQPEFELTLMDGLWYELARTRFTFNKLESVVTRHTYDPVENVINSIYTGATYFPDNDTSATCNPAILGMSRTKDGASLIGDMEGRIGGEESGYFWVPMKVLYADADYLMFYACYYVGNDGHCMPGMMEVSLLGRIPVVSIEARDVIYSILPESCVNPNDMVDTLFKTNCSDWVKQVNEIDPSDCNLLDIPQFDDYENHLLDGTWYLYKSISYSNRTLSGVVITKTTSGREDPIRTHIYAYDPDNSSLCVEYDTLARQTCLDTGDHIVTPPTGLTGSFYFSKILNVSSDMLVEYTCTMRNLDNTCDKTGVQFNVYTKDKRLLDFGRDDDYDDNDEDDDNDDVEDDDDSVDNDDDNDNNDDVGDEVDNALIDEEIRKAFEELKEQFDDIIDGLARSVCLDPKDLVTETEWCFEEADNFTDTFVTSECDIDNHYIMGDVDDFIQEDIEGYWYEILRKKDITHLTREGPLVAFISADTNETLQIHYTFHQDDGENVFCADVQNTILLPRCYADSNGDYMARFGETETQVTYVPFKVVYVNDAKTVMMTYVCEHMTSDGTCAANASFIRIWARTANLTHEEIEDVFPYAEWVCVDTEDDHLFVEFQHIEDSSCLPSLENYVVENVIVLDDVTTVTPEVEGDAAEQQQDQIWDSLEWDDIDWELWKPDDEFY